MSITLIIIIITCIVSFLHSPMEKCTKTLSSIPLAVTTTNNGTASSVAGLIHADWAHLLFNMWALYLFGTALEQAFASVFGQMGKIFYLLLYISSLFFCLIPTYAKHKDDSSYRSFGASGAVSAVIFAAILYVPLMNLRFFFIPIDIKDLFSAHSTLSSLLPRQRGGDNVNHSAHIWGGLYGMHSLL